MIKDMHHKVILLSRPAFPGTVLAFFVMSFLPLQAQYSLQLDSPGTYIMHENNPKLQLDEYTLECWFSIDNAGIAIQSDTSGFTIIPLVAKGFQENIPDAGINYLLGIREQDHILYTVFEEKVPAGFSRRYQSLNGYTPLQENKWYHAAVTFNGVYLSLYLNGNLESVVETDTTPLTACMNDLAVGTTLDAGGLEHGSFRGRFDGIRLWNYARSQTEIREQLNTETQIQQPGLMLALDLNEGEGHILHAVGLLNAPVLVGDQFTWTQGSPTAILLPPACSFQPELTIGLISDPQYCDFDPTGTRFYRESLGKIAEAIDTFNARKVDFVMSLGDLTDRYAESYDSVQLLYEKLDAPDYKLFGNHEFEQVPDSVKHTLIGRYEMPDYYYDFSYKGWQFLVLDATELAGYTRVLHPGLAEEGDSLWQRVQGQINAYDWNGGISRKQLEWIRQKLTVSYEKAAPVIIFCHHQVFPFNCRKNLWNDTAVVELVSQFPNVVAFINGHNHDGDFGFYKGIPFLTHRAMVETKELNSFSILSVYPDRIEIDGRDLNRDRIWAFNRKDTLSRSIRISNDAIHSVDSSGSYIGSLSLQRNDDLYDMATYQLSRDTLNGQLFSISGDTLFLQTNENLSKKGHLQVNIHAMNCLRQEVSDNLVLDFDSVTISLLNPLPDTLVDVNQKSLYLPVNEVFTDHSRHGITLSVKTEDPDKATLFIENSNLVCWPHQLGETMVLVTAHDAFAGYSITDTLLLKIRRIYNHTPYVTCTLDFVFLTAGRDTLMMLPDTMFTDPDGDTLNYSFFSNDLQTAEVSISAGRLLVIPAGKGETEIIIKAADPYGGEILLMFHVTVQEAILVKEHPFCRNYFELQYIPGQHEILINTRFEKKGIQITINDISGNNCGILYRGELPAGINHLAMDGVYPPGGYVLVIRQGNTILQTQKIVIHQ